MCRTSCATSRALRLPRPPPTDPFGNLAGFTIRGVSNNRVQMLVDGTRVIESIIDGNRDFVDMANLKAVEIIRGPAGVMWGADALGGVVAFVTKDPEDYLKGRNFGGQLDTRFDSYDKSFVKTGTTAFRFGDFAAMISASQRSYNEGTLTKARADGGIYGCPRIRRPSAATSSIRSTATMTTCSASWCGLRTTSTR